jgi:3-methylcrotonyl-CoA carboxylase alpha subunit
MPYHFQLTDPLDRKSDAGASQTGIQSPMPGLVKQVAVQAGQNVHEGDALLMLEAMKMEHILRAPRDCLIEEVLCTPEQQVQAGDLLIQFASQDVE